MGSCKHCKLSGPSSNSGKWKDGACCSNLLRDADPRAAILRQRLQLTLLMIFQAMGKREPGVVRVSECGASEPFKIPGGLVDID